MTHSVRIEFHAYRMLHPRVGDEDPNRRNTCPDTRHPGSQQVCLLTHLVPTEEHHGKEGCFHEEGQDTFDSQWRTEDVAHEPRVVAPIGTEFEFKDDARSDTHGKINGEEFHPELGCPFPELVFLDDIKGLHGCHDHCQTEGQRDENPMVTGRQSKLRS